MTKRLLILFILSIGLDCYSQTIVDLLDRETLDAEKHIKEVSETSPGGGVTILTYNRNGRLISRVPYPKTAPCFSIFWEYTDTLPKFRTDSIETNFGRKIDHYTYDYDSNGFLRSIRNHSSEGRLIHVIRIENDSIGNPLRLETFDSRGNSIGYEVARYSYDLNLAEIKVFNKFNQIMGIILNPIDKQKPVIPIKEYLSNNSYGYLEPVAKDWYDLRVTYNQFDYKYNKDGFWKKEIRNQTGHFPATGKIEHLSNVFITRRVREYYK